MRRIRLAWFLALVMLACWPRLGAAAGDVFDPAEFLKPTVCPAFYDLKGGVCELRAEEAKQLTKKSCINAGFKFPEREAPDAKGKCEAADVAPGPECKPISGRRSRQVPGADGGQTCLYDNPIPVSGLGDYVGDCIKIKAVPTGTPLKGGETYVVTAQRDAGPTDRELTLVEGRVLLGGYWFGCRTVDNGRMTELPASLINQSGATRSGYAFGALTMPYKYFVGDKSFVTQVPIGAYLGWRTGQAGSGWTAAAAFTLGSVKADTVDPTRLDASGKPIVTGTADVAALSLAGGVMFDILKSPAAKPFKAGVFFGRDVVNNDPSIAYRFNRKTWIAVQIGYDFTDN